MKYWTSYIIVLIIKMSNKIRFFEVWHSRGNSGSIGPFKHFEGWHVLIIMDGWNYLSLKFPDKSGLGGKHIKNLQMWTDQTCEDWSSSGGRTGNILTSHRSSNFLHWTENYYFRIDQYVPNAINTWHIFSHTCNFPRLWWILSHIC